MCTRRPPRPAAELQNRTIQAFDRYVRLTEARLNGNAPFLWIDGLPETRRREALDAVRRRELSIERLETKDNGPRDRRPGGMIHHWIGTAFVPGATIDQALTVLQNYNEHYRIYAPTVAASKLQSHEGDRFTFFLRFVMKKVITVVVNSDHEAVFRKPAADRAEGWIHSTRIAEVENPGTPAEREKPVGNDGGYLWRLNTYWRLLARDGGLYIHCESVSLSRGFPTGLRLDRRTVRDQHSPRVADIHTRDHAESARAQSAIDGRWRRSSHERIFAAPTSTSCRSSRCSRATRTAFALCSTRAIRFAPQSFLT